jgi:hypothetical protein
MPDRKVRIATLDGFISASVRGMAVGATALVTYTLYSLLLPITGPILG